MKAKSSLVIVSLLLTSNAFAAERLVPAQYSTIQAAIDDAQGGDVVVVAPGTYRENINFKGKPITVRSTNPRNWETIRNTVVNGGASQSGGGRRSLQATSVAGSCVVFDHGETSSSILEGITLTNGWGIPMADPYDRQYRALDQETQRDHKSEPR